MNNAIDVGATHLITSFSLQMNKILNYYYTPHSGFLVYTDSGYIRKRTFTPPHITTSFYSNSSTVYQLDYDWRYVKIFICEKDIIIRNYRLLHFTDNSTSFGPLVVVILPDQNSMELKSSL